MRYLHYLQGDRAAWARVEGDFAVELTAAPWKAESRDLRRFQFEPGLPLLPPCEPTKILCVGKNYREHLRELHPGEEVPREPLLFLKPPSALLPPGGEICLPPESERVDYEGELALVIGKKVHRPTLEEARAAIFGFTVANDVTARDLQKKDGQWTRGKGFDTFCPVGPWIKTTDPGDVLIITRVNGEIHQQARLTQMIFPPAEIVRYAAGIMTLLPGDLILTGTPEGVAPLQPGDAVEVEIQGIGILRNTVETRVRYDHL
jgi:2-keto-4-pentenoate hydratase/2-oxohepta-3-ene-1,7-dioic acid hydratase in catechol pathway